MNTLTYSGTTLVLPDDMLWVNEYSWSPVRQSTRMSITGALIVDTGVMQAGRQIELTGGDQFAWSTIGVADMLRAWAMVGGAQMTLVLRGGAARQVIFDHERGALDVTPVENARLGYSDPLPDDLCWMRIRLIEI